MHPPLRDLQPRHRRRFGCHHRPRPQRLGSVPSLRHPAVPNNPHLCLRGTGDPTSFIPLHPPINPPFNIHPRHNNNPNHHPHLNPHHHPCPTPLRPPNPHPGRSRNHNPPHHPLLHRRLLPLPQHRRHQSARLPGIPPVLLRVRLHRDARHRRRAGGRGTHVSCECVAACGCHGRGERGGVWRRGEGVCGCC